MWRRAQVTAFGSLPAPALVLVLSLLASGHGFAQDDAHPRAVPGHQRGLQHKEQITGLSRSLTWATPRAAADAEVLLVSLLDGRIVAVDSSNGAILWTFDSGSPLVTARQPLGSPAGVTIFPDGTDGSLYAYHMVDTGKARMERLPVTLQDLVEASPSLTDDGSVVLGKRVTTLYQLDAVTGELRRALSDLQGGLEDHTADGMPAVPLLDPASVVLLGREDFSVRSVQLRSGAEVWNATFSRVAPIRPLSSVATSSALEQDPEVAPQTPRLTVAADNTLQAFDASTGYRRWSVAFNTPPVAVFSVKGSGENHLLLASPRRASVPHILQAPLVPGPWRSTFPASPNGREPPHTRPVVPTSTHVLVGTLGGSLYALPADQLLMDQDLAEGSPWTPAPVPLSSSWVDSEGYTPEPPPSQTPPRQHRHPPLAIANAAHETGLVPAIAKQSGEEAIVSRLTCPQGLHTLRQSGGEQPHRMAWLPDAASMANRSVGRGSELPEPTGFRPLGWLTGWRSMVGQAMLLVVTLLLGLALARASTWLQLQQSAVVASSAASLSTPTAKLPAVQQQLVAAAMAQADAAVKGVDALSGSDAVVAVVDGSGLNENGVELSTAGSSKPGELSMLQEDSPCEPLALQVRAADLLDGSANGNSITQLGVEHGGEAEAVFANAPLVSGSVLQPAVDVEQQQAVRGADAANSTPSSSAVTTLDELATQLRDSEGEQQAGASSSGRGMQESSAEKFVQRRRMDPSRHCPDGSLAIGRLRVGPGILGYGSAGTIVYQGVLDGRSVAVKRLLRQFYDLAKKEIEVLIVSDEHPNVVRCFAMEEDREFVYLALERCRSTLSDYLGDAVGRSAMVDPGSKQPLPRCFEVMADIAKGLAALHERDIVHRDLKPHNVLITDTGRAKLSDMGLCKQLVAEQSSFESHGAGGSSGWQAPEQLIARDGGMVRQARSMDIFSMGCVLYFCITAGRHPFGESYERDTNILRSKPSLAPLSMLPEAHNLLLTMLHKDGLRRPSMPAVLAHPMWWSAEQRLQFLLDISDRVETEDREPDQSLLAALEAVAPAGIGKNWGTQVPAELIANLGRYRRYDYTSLRDLLRVIRNKRSHFREMPPALQASLGPIPEGFVRYFSSRFPNLLMACYCFGLQQLSEEPHLQRYWPAGAASCEPFVAAFLQQHAAKLRPPASAVVPAVPPAQASPARAVPPPEVVEPAMPAARTGSGPSLTTSLEKGPLVSNALPLSKTAVMVAAATVGLQDLAPVLPLPAQVPGQPQPLSGSCSDLATGAAVGSGPTGDVVADGGSPTAPALSSSSTEEPTPAGRAASYSTSLTPSGRSGSQLTSGTLRRGQSTPRTDDVGPASTSAASSPLVVVGYDVAEQDDTFDVRAFPQRPGKTVCDFFAKTGHCKFGDGCVFDHPEQHAVKLNRLGLPLRPDVAICTFYLKNNECRFGPACKFHHPTLRPVYAGSAGLTEGPAQPDD